MKEEIGDLFENIGTADVLCITTNGDVNKAGQAVMGRGVALQAAKRWPPIRHALASALKHRGNVVNVLGVIGGQTHLPIEGCRATAIVAFPVKHHWWQKADLALIEESAMRLAGEYSPERTTARRIVLPRAGCGNGGLSWEEVRPILARHLDDRFVVVERGP